jgi:hypothetical protein
MELLIGLLFVLFVIFFIFYRLTGELFGGKGWQPSPGGFLKSLLVVAGLGWLLALLPGSSDDDGGDGEC